MSVVPRVRTLPRRRSPVVGVLVTRGSGSRAPTTELRRRGETRFDIFVVFAIGTVLVTRASLALAGFPQIGGGGLHIAHVLWGGLLLAAAVLVSALGVGSRSATQSCVIGGIGFGLFIDEVGKFVTTDTNYFFRPALAIMYAVFVLGFLAVNEIRRRRPVHRAMLLANAANASADAMLGQLGGTRRARILADLAGLDGPEVVRIRLLLTESAAPVSARAGIEDVVDRIRTGMAKLSARAIGDRRVVIGVLSCVTLVAAYDVAFTIAALVGPDGDQIGTAESVAAGTSAVAAVVTLTGAFELARGRTGRGLSLVRAALLINVLVTDLFLFVTMQFAQLGGLAVNLILLGVVSTALAVTPGPDDPPVSGAAHPPVIDTVAATTSGNAP